jgi:hypothetical protein
VSAVASFVAAAVVEYAKKIATKGELEVIRFVEQCAIYIYAQNFFTAGLT